MVARWFQPPRLIESPDAAETRAQSSVIDRFLGDVTKVQSRTGAQVLIEDLAGEFKGPAVVESGGLISVKGKVYR